MPPVIDRELNGGATRGSISGGLIPGGGWGTLVRSPSLGDDLHVC